VLKIVEIRLNLLTLFVEDCRSFSGHVVQMRLQGRRSGSANHSDNGSTYLFQIFFLEYVVFVARYSLIMVFFNSCTVARNLCQPVRMTA